MEHAGPIAHTTEPSVTGTSVLGIKYKDGVLLAADTLGSYGSLAKFRSLERVRSVSDNTAIAASGEYSDFMYIMELLEELIKSDRQEGDGYRLQPRAIQQYLGRVLYQRRSKVNPLWNQLLIGGVGDDGKPFLGQVDLYGSSFEGDTLATGYGAYIAQPLLRKAHRPDMTEEEARKVLVDCLRVLLYRDARALNKFQIARVTAAGVEVTPIDKAFKVDTYWTNPLFVNPAKAIPL